MSRLIFALLLLIPLAACHRDSIVGGALSPEERESGHHYIELLRTGQLDEIVRNADGALNANDVRSALNQMATQFPNEDPTEVHLVRSRSISGQDPSGAQATRIDMTYEYRFPSAPVLASIALKRTATATSIVSFNAVKIPVNFNDFTMTGATPTKYAVIAAAVIVPLFSLWTFFVCLRTPMDRTRKSLWCIFIVISFGQFNIDWVTGLWTLQPISVLFLGFAAVRGIGGYGPWVLSVGLPVGAIVFHIWRNRMRRDAELVATQG